MFFNIYFLEDQDIQAELKKVVECIGTNVVSN